MNYFYWTLRKKVYVRTDEFSFNIIRTRVIIQKDRVRVSNSDSYIIIQTVAAPLPPPPTRKRDHLGDYRGRLVVIRNRDITWEHMG